MKQIDVLSDDVLLEIFYFYTIIDPSFRPDESKKATAEAWQLLVHVCRRWRNLVLGSPRHLNLRLFCTSKTSITDTLDVWPTLPLIVDSGGVMVFTSDTRNIIAALGQSNRVCQVDLKLGSWRLEEVLAPMQVLFPELTDLRLSSYDHGTPPIIPDSFLGGSAPRLRYFELHGIPFPRLPSLLLTATHLVELRLYKIPHFGYISPKAMVALISVLSSLRELALGFGSPLSLPDGESRSLPLPKPSIIPALRKFDFRGVTEYLEDLVTRIDTPLLDKMHINLFNQVDFDCPQLVQFINRSPTLRARDEAHVQFSHHITSVVLLAQSRFLKIEILAGRERDWQLSFIRQICNSPLHPLSTVEDLYVEYLQLVYAIENLNTLWWQLFFPFTAVKNLYISKEFAPGIAAALQELVGGTITGVLPSLQNIFVERLEPSGPFQEKIGRFVAARQLSDHPIAISNWDKINFRFVIRV